MNELEQMLRADLRDVAGTVDIPISAVLRPVGDPSGMKIRIVLGAKRSPLSSG